MKKLVKKSPCMAKNNEAGSEKRRIKEKITNIDIIYT